MKKVIAAICVVFALSPYFSESFKKEIVWYNNRTVKCGWFEVDPAWMQLPDGRYGLEFTIRF